MEKFYVFILASRRHRHLSVGATARLEDGIRAHRARMSRRLGRSFVYQKLVYVEWVRSVGEAVKRQQQLTGMDDEARRDLVRQVNPTWQRIPLSSLRASGYSSN